MKTVEDYEGIRRAYFVDKLSIRAINRTLGYDRETIRKAIVQAAPMPYTLEKPREAPVIGPYKQRIVELLKESKKQKRKQRFTAHRIFKILQGEGYSGSEGAVHNYVSRERRKDTYKEKYIPLEFDPGQDAQVDWGEADAILAGKQVTVQFFTLRLNYSKARFVMAFPFQKQEAFFEGHNQAFRFFGGVPRRLTYDNLKTAVYKILTGHNRQEQEAFKKFRSYYLFESNYCNPAQGHEKGGVENDVGYAQRNFMTPLLKAHNYEELNAMLWKACQENLYRRVRGQLASVADLLADERSQFLPLTGELFPASVSSPVKPNGYSQVELDTNRYSVPVEHGNDQLVLRAYPFRVEISLGEKVIATHPRCFGREQDVLDPLHYLTLLEQRPGAFEHAKPLRRWRVTEVGEKYLHAPEGVQVWLLFLTWWTQVNWGIAVAYAPENFPTQRLRPAARQHLLSLTVERPMPFEIFADQLIAAAGLIWPAGSAENQRSILHGLIASILAEPLSDFGVLKLTTGPDPRWGSDIQVISELTLTAFGQALLSHLEITE